MDFVALQRKNYEEIQKRQEKKIMSVHYLNAYYENVNESPAMREALALKRVHENCGIAVYPYELVVGRIACDEPVGFHIGCGTYLNYEAAEEYILQNTMTEKSKSDLYNMLDVVKKNKFLNIWERGFYEVNPEMFTDEEIKAINCGAAASTFFAGHMVLDFDQMLQQGLGFYKEKLLASEQNDYIKALLITLESFQTIIRRTAEKCEAISNECEEEFRENMRRAAKDLYHIVEHKPQTFCQALQLVWFGHICNNSDSFGRFDKYLYPFYKSDIESGLLTREKALEILKSLMIKIDEQNQIQNMTIGGVMPDGGKSYTELTEIVLEATREMKYKGPNLSIRINKDMPKHFWNHIAKSLGTGQGLPALYNEDNILGWLNNYGIEREDALDFSLGGCSQVNIPGRSQYVNDIGLMNIAKIFELTLYNGMDLAMSGDEIGLKTGEAEEFLLFEDLLTAFKKQLDYFVQLEASVNNKIVDYIGRTEGYNLRSIFTRDCIENYKGVFQGGARYNSIQLECIGITNAADCLTAVKKAVYEDKICTMPELKNALLNNFMGHENLRAYLKNKTPKFGNDDDYADQIRQDISSYIYDALRSQKATLGGYYIPGEVIFTVHEWQGSITGATPDGRLKGTVLADSAGASQGADKNGPTALMKSVLKIPNDKILTSIVLNLKFLKEQWEKDNEKVIMLFQAFFREGGEQLQVNVCDQEELKKAYENPELFPNLVVRVGGYSAYFSSLSRALQLDIIERTASKI